MKPTRLLLFAFLFFTTLTYSQSGEWEIKYEKRKVFIENLGQFDAGQNETTGEVLYVADLPYVKIMFGEKGISYQLKEIRMIPKDQRKMIEEAIISSVYEHKQKERLLGKFLISEDEINMKFDQVNANVEIVAEGLTSDYQTYAVPNPETGEDDVYSYVRQYESITYKNFLNGIDIKYTIHPDGGIKYAIYVNPGANPEEVRMIYDVNVALSNGELRIPSLFGDIIDHEPITFYASDPSQIIPSQFKIVDGKVQFEVGSYDQNKAIVIDPWTQTPNFNLAWDLIWELDTDANGYVYTIGGIDNLTLQKWDGATGVLQWSFNTGYDTTSWMGTLSTDNAGNSYITQGSIAAIKKINTSGAQVWNNGNPGGFGSSLEFWSISFNCDQTKLVVGGTGGGAFSLRGHMFDINVSTGAVMNDQEIAAGAMFSIPTSIQELRSIAAGFNGKYYFITLDTIGYLSDNFNLCPTGTTLYKTDHGRALNYKCENYRYNNSGIRAIRANQNYVYTAFGDLLQRRDLTTGLVINQVAIPGGGVSTSFSHRSVHNSGIDIDDCGNVYVGSKTGVYRFTADLSSQTGFWATAYNVYDVRVNNGGRVVACGGTGTGTLGTTRTGGVNSFDAAACNKLLITCCNSAVCNPGILCENDPPVTLTPQTPGGIWSGTGVNASGVFDPSIAGIGNHAITYTLPCGSETILISVIACNDPIAVCEESNNTLTASGGDGTYSWYTGTSTSTTINITNASTCTQCGGTPINGGFFGFYNHCEYPLGTTITSCTQFNFSWNAMPYATGSNTSPPASYPILIIDGAGDSLIVNSAAELTECTPIQLSVYVGSYDISCLGDRVLLEWTTLSENQNAGFEIERAYSDGHFNLAGTVDGAINSTSERHYSFSDQDPVNERAYYRLYEVNLNGERTEIGTKTIDCNNGQVSIYPNPFSDVISVDVGDLLINADGILELLDNLGKVVFVYAMPKNTAHFEFNTSELSKGIYTVRIISNNSVVVKKMTK